MGKVWEEIEILGIRKSKTVTALFDSGAFHNYIRSENIYDGETPDDIGFHVFEGTKQSILADGSMKEVDWVIFKELRIGKIIIKEPRFLVMRNLTWDAIIGADLMQKARISLNIPKEKLMVNKVG